MPNKKQFFVLTGDPGVGKTTLTKKIVSILSQKGVHCFGFYTEEIRKNGVREGFDVVNLHGIRGRLARDLNLLDGPVKNKVGKYGVLIPEFEKVALHCFEMPKNNSKLLVIDEIGKMEFFSGQFKMRVKETFSASSNRVVLATIPLRKSDPLIENIRNDPRVTVWIITHENRNCIHEEILREICETFNC